ncbi:MAG TPA: hypothetical protein VKD67_03420 [Acidimicrobiales bacterium]|nr:hypothetical protein [Acidimicrobiales bacterium]
MPDDTNPPTRTWSSRLRIGVATLVVVAAATTGGLALAGGFTKQQTPGPTQSNAEELIGVEPVRVLDTRGPNNGPIGVPAAKPITGGETIEVQVGGFTDKSGNLLIPANATSVAANITIDEDATLKSFVTVWPTGSPQPFTSANNAEPGLVMANSAILKLGPDGKLNVFNQRGDVNVIIDITGYFLPCGAPLQTAVAPTTTVAPTTSTGATTTSEATTTTATTAVMSLGAQAQTCTAPVTSPTTGVTTTTGPTTTTTTTPVP